MSLIAPDARICPALLGDLYRKILDRIEAARFDVFDTNPDLSITVKLRLLGSAWWRYKRRGSSSGLKDR